MRILIFNWRDLRHSWAGGGEIYVFEQASRWVKMGHEVILFCGQDPYQNLPSFEIINGIKIYRKGGRFLEVR
ncbi:MAG: Glycosyl transferase, group 1 [Candidatus Levybacteria bacterium GW2011_GWB1_37_8]|nr:MAG: Glycosyl transferase, group 1 [Candidatus Levybacteria bacterium GW2011_GWB1_37_8]